MDDSAITSDEIIEELKTFLANFNKKVDCKTEFQYFTCIFINY